MEQFLLVLAVLPAPLTLALLLPPGWIQERRDRRLAALLLLLGALAVIAGSAVALWLLPGAIAEAACVVGSAFLMLLSLFSIMPVCPRSSGLETAMAVALSGVAMAVYGGTRLVVLASRRRRD
ncbi:MAG: hypothetical protein ACKOPT_06620 [Cyanobium sp.]|jgi:hypothetical protein|nr:hypothetical protein [Cyanobium sp. FGCU6]